MDLSIFEYPLPESLIAQYPVEKRRDSRLLCLDGKDGRVADRNFSDLPEFIDEGDVLILNDTKVIPARLYGKKETGGKVEVMVEQVLDQQRVLALLGTSRSVKLGSRIKIDGGPWVEVEAHPEHLFQLRFESDQTVEKILQQLGHIPLPPYIRRQDEKADQNRYQTVYARFPGAVAAPTAGLHFDKEMFSQLSAKGVDHAFITLHVGSGTFKPVRVEDPQDHVMHPERIVVSAEVCARISKAKSDGRRVIAVGTTTVRALETAALSGKLKPFAGESELFIYPGFEFKVVEGLITNFHLPGSTLLMLVCAFAGIDQTMGAYQHAIDKQYRFYSYGDAMYLTRRKV
ncbi:tRNA preQ1(34) S-adenosylmethionine ribosyltransferase-isomerase QueA [Pseudomonadota bacterium]